MAQHNSTFQINDVVLSIPPESITIDRAAQIKQYKPIRTKGAAKMRSPSSTVVINVQVPFVGIDDINLKLRPLVAQFLLTPFCFVENQYLRDTMLGTNSDANMALALQNLSISTIDGQPDTWNVNFQFIWFNYKPYSKDFKFKKDLFSAQSQSTPSDPFKLFYANQLNKLEPVSLFNSDLSLSTLEFMMARVNPDLEAGKDQTIDLDIDRLKDFQDLASQTFSNVEDFINTLGSDSNEALTLRQILSGFQNDSNVVTDVQNTIRAIDSVTNQAKTVSPNDSKLKAIIAQRDKLIQDSSLIFKGNVWLEYPVAQKQGSNLFRGNTESAAKLYYKVRSINTRQSGFTTGLVATSITMNFNHKLVMLPMQGYQYPTAQHLGSDDVSFNVHIACLDDESNREVADFWNVTQNNLQYAKFIPQDLTSVQVNNELFKFMGVTSVLLSAKRDSTVPGQPGLYSHELEIVENGLKPFDLEQIQSTPTSSRGIRSLIWKAILSNNAFALGGVLHKHFSLRVTWKDPRDSSHQFLDKLNVRGITNEQTLNSMVNRLFKELSDEETFVDRNRNSRNIFLILGGMKDSEVLGASYLADIFYQATQSNIDGTGKLAFDKAKIPEAINVYRQDQMTRLKRSQAIGSMRTAIATFDDRSSDIDFVSNQGITFKDGSLLLMSQLFPDSDIRASVVEKLDKAVNLQNSISSGELGREVTLDAEDDSKLRKDVLVSAIRELETELISFKNNTTRTNVVDLAFRNEINDLFIEWNRFAVDVADTIIDSFIDLEIFSEARAELDKQKFRIDKSLYQDMNFNEIQGFVKQSLGVPGIQLELEPDFYFYNESIDGTTRTALTPSAIADVKEKTINYMSKVSEQNMNWYQESYLKKVSPEVLEFLQKSNPAGTPVQLDADVQTTPGLSQLTKEIDINSKSANGYTAHISGTEYQVNMNKAGFLTPTTQSNFDEQLSIHNQSSNVEETLTGNSVAGLNSTEIQAAYGAWIHPFPGAVITSTPGFRSIDKLGSGFHRGTDLAYPRDHGRDVTTGRSVLSTLEGIVTVASEISGGGLTVYVESDSIWGTLVHKYMHLSALFPNIKVGAKVAAGQPVGLAGNSGLRSTGPHLHFEVAIKSNDTVIYPFGSYKGDRIITSAGGQTRSVIVGDLIATNQKALPYLPSAGLAGLSAGLSAFDQSLNQLESSWSKEAGYRMNRAYPSVYLSFIEEDTEDARIYRFDDYFSFASIVSLYTVKDREVAADYTYMELTNLSGLLSNRKFEGSYNEESPIYNGKEARDSDARRDPLSVDTAEEFRFESLLLREGMKTEIRLGYSNDPNSLEVMFVGRIVGVQFSDSDDLVQLEMQSLATELVQDIKGAENTEVHDGWFFSDARTGPLLETLMASPECVSFGFWKRGDQIGNADRELLTSRWEWNPNPAADNIFAPMSDHLDPRKFLLGSSFGTKLIGAAATAFAVGGGIALATGAALPAAALVGLSSIFGFPGAAILGQAVTGNVLQDVFGIPVKGLFSALSYFMYQMTIWDVFKEMEHRHPDCVASPVPYTEKSFGRQRMTMFFGNPDWLYFASDPIQGASVKTQEIKDRAEQLKDALRNRSNSEYRFESLQNFANATDMSDESLAMVPNLVERIGAEERDDELFDDIDRIVDNERRLRAISNSSMRPFRRYHIVTSQQHIVSNNIRVKSSNTFNAVTINFAGSEEDIEQTSEGPKITDLEELTMKLDPLIPDESIREAVYTYPNCQGEEMAKRYAVSHLQKSCWSIYQGDLVILGNPSIKPYDIVFVYDEYTDMYGPVQVRRITHMFDYEHGFISVITPDLLTTVTEGVTMSNLHAMGLMAEHFLGLKDVVTPGISPQDEVQTTPWKLLLGAGALNIASIFGAKKLLFVTQFGHPVRIHPLIKQGNAMVAGFGPPGVRSNEFVINDAYEWYLTRSRAISDTYEDFKRMFDNRDGILNTRGKIFADNDLGGDSKFSILSGRNQK